VHRPRASRRRPRSHAPTAPPPLGNSP
jgi:hypothetical protein